MLNNNEYHPFVVWLDNPEESTINLFDDEMFHYVSIFGKVGRDGGGYDWTAVARTLDRMIPGFEDGALGFNPEAGMLSVYGRKDRIEVLAAKLQWLITNHQELEKIIKQSELD